MEEKTIVLENKKSTIKNYELLKGLTLSVIDSDGFSLSFPLPEKEKEGDVVVISSCIKGRLQKTSGEEYTYLGEGDLSLNAPLGNMESDVYPLDYFKGVRLVIEMPKFKEALSSLGETFGNIAIDLGSLADTLAGEKNFLYFRENRRFFEITSAMMEGRDEFYLNLKSLELIYEIISSLRGCYPARFYEKDRVEKVMEMRKFLIDHIEEKHTQEELSRVYRIPLTSLKECFKSIYGEPLNTCIRDYKVERAAKLLRETRLSVLKIAEMVGYANQSKFAEVFKEKMNMSPIEYRNKQ